MSNRPDSFFTMYGGDFLRDTMHLNTRQSGAYQLLLIHYYGKGGPLPLDDDQVRAITREQPAEWKIDRPIVMAFFQKQADGWHQKRADKELAGMKVRYERALKGAEAKHAASTGQAGGKHRPKHKTSDSLGEVQAGAYGLLNGYKPHPSFPSEKEGVARAAARATAAPPVATAEPGWEIPYERWLSFKTALGLVPWATWFAPCRPNGSETVLLAPSAYARDEIGKRFYTALEAHFGEPVTIKVMDGAAYQPD